MASFPCKEDASDSHEQACAVPFCRMRVPVAIDAIWGTGIRTKQDARTSNQKVGHFFTMRDDLNIIRRFCAVGGTKDIRVVELPGCKFPTKVLLRFSVCSGAGQIDSSGVGVRSITERTCVIPTASSISILRHRNPCR